MRHLIQVIGVVNLVAFAALALVAVRQWRSRREPAAAWAALAFGSLAFVVILGRLLPMHPHHLGAKVGQRVDIAVLVLFRTCSTASRRRSGRPRHSSNGS